MNLFRQLIGWLNRRFPEQLVVSVEEYKEMRQELAQYNVIIQGVSQLNDRLVMLENDVKRLNTANGFVNLKKGSLSLER
jgi:hypothetical protein